MKAPLLLFAIFVAQLFPPGLARGDDFVSGMDAYLHGDYGKAWQIWKPLAEQGDPKAQIFAARAYLNSRLTTDEKATTEKWLRSAADQGYASAQFALAKRVSSQYKYGDKNYLPSVRIAEDLIRRAAEQGHVGAQLKLIGFGEVREDTEKRKQALAFIEQAANQGSAMAKVWLGQFYVKGIAVKQDAEESIKWFKKASEHPFPYALDLLGQAYAYGVGVQSDSVESYKWSYLAANTGFRPSEERIKSLAKNMSSEEIFEAIKRANLCISKKYKGC